MQAGEQLYAELPPSLRRRLQPDGSKGDASKSDSKTFEGLVPLVARGSIPSKLANKAVPLENPDKESDWRKERKAKAKSEREKRKIANKRRRSGRIVKVPGQAGPSAKDLGKPLVKGHVSYDLMEPLHRLWLGYISELLGLPLRDATNANQVVGNTSTTATPSETQSIPHTETQHVRTVQALEDGISLTKMQGWQAKLVKADFHGCKIEVKRAKHPSLVGLAGIVVQETENTFRIVTAKNAIKVTPKENVTYTFSLPLESADSEPMKDLRFDLHGGNFAFRGSDRASKKFKAKGTKGFDF